jgi:hypothetical protein
MVLMIAKGYGRIETDDKYAASMPSTRVSEFLSMKNVVVRASGP